MKSRRERKEERESAAENFLYLIDMLDRDDWDDDD